MTETYFDQHLRDISIVLSGNEPGSHWRHDARASSYRVVGAVTIQSAVPVPDGTVLVLYEADETGFYYGRPRPEFQDGRFTRLDINTPHVDHFLSAVSIEADHQQQRWGVDHDAGKTPLDWFWLIGFLAQKAAFAAIGGDEEKARHHMVSTAAAIMNWFRGGRMRPAK